MWRDAAGAARSNIGPSRLKSGVRKPIRAQPHADASGSSNRLAGRSSPPPERSRRRRAARSGEPSARIGTPAPAASLTTNEWRLSVTFSPPSAGDAEEAIAHPRRLCRLPIVPCSCDALRRRRARPCPPRVLRRPPYGDRRSLGCARRSRRGRAVLQPILPALTKARSRHRRTSLGGPGDDS